MELEVGERDISRCALRENVASGELCLEYVPGSIHLADILTKAVPAQRHREISAMWGMVKGAAGKLKARVLSLIMMCACCCTVEGAPGDSGLAIDNFIEFYVVLGMATVTLLVFWEGLGQNSSLGLRYGS